MSNPNEEELEFKDGLLDRLQQEKFSVKAVYMDSPSGAIAMEIKRVLHDGDGTIIVLKNQ